MSKNNYNSVFSKRLSELMDGINSPLERTVTQKELSDNVGVSRQVISQYCLGNTSPNVETLINIAEFFNVSSDYLIGRTDELDEMPIEDLEKERNLLKHEIKRLRKAIDNINEILDNY